MRATCVGIWLGLVLVAPVARANEQTPTVKESPLTRVRTQLTHYDLEPQGTVALLPQLGDLARTLAGPEAAEAAFLRAAAASDLYFLANFLGNDALRTALAAALGVPSDAVATAIANELAASAQGLYREPAQLALAALQHSEPAENVPSGPPDLRRDARFLHAATELMKDPAAGARFAALAVDPCTREACPAPVSDFDADGRRAFVYLQQLSAAALRFERGRGEGDPLIEALAPLVARDIAKARAFALRLPARIAGDPQPQPNGSVWPAPDVVVFARPSEVAFARGPRVQIVASGAVERLAEPAPVFPALTTIRYGPNDSSLPTKAIDDLVAGLRELRGATPDLRALLVVEPEVTALLPSRALASLRKAGMTQLRFAAVSKAGTLLTAEVHTVMVNLDPTNDPDLKLRVRVGGYSLDIGHGVTDIPRIRDDAGLHFDVATLRERATARAPKSAAVSFMPDVATEQVLVALLQVTPARTPIDLWIQ